MRELMEEKREVRALDPDVHDLILAICREGGSFVKCQVAIGISHGTWQKWQEKYEEFKEVVEEGRRLSQVWWEDKGQAHMFEKGFNAPAYAFMLANRFPEQYTQRHQVDLKTDVNVTLLDEVRKRNAALREQHEHQYDRLRLVARQGNVIEGQVVGAEEDDGSGAEHG